MKLFNIVLIIIFQLKAYFLIFSFAKFLLWYGNGKFPWFIEPSPGLFSLANKPWGDVLRDCPISILISFFIGFLIYRYGIPAFKELKLRSAQ